LTMYTKLYFSYGLYCVNSKIYCVLQGLCALNSWSGRTQHPGDLLTCRVCFVKHMMITTQVRHHTHLDLSTCRVCSGKNMMITREYFPQLWYNPYPWYARGLGLCLFLVRWSVICYQDCCFMDRQKRIATRHICEKYRHIDLCVYTHLQDLSHGPHDQTAKTGQEISVGLKRSIRATILHGKL